MRKIIHIDMDAFFASIEQRDFPELKGKPVVVGGSSERGVVAAASYEARRYGIHSAMPSRTAVKRCPQLIFQPHRFEVYKEVSRQIRAVFHEYTDLVEPLSLDEAFLDVTENKLGIESATQIAGEIKRKIWEETRLTASAGVSINKFLAKVASDQKKPDGLFVIKPKDVMGFIEQLPVTKFFGVGKKTAEKMHALNIHHGRDLQKFDLPRLIHHFGKAGAYFYEVSRGEDRREVKAHRERKSVGIENTFRKDLYDNGQIIHELEELRKELVKRMTRSGKFGKTLTLKIKFATFEQITRSRTSGQPIKTDRQIKEISQALLKEAVIKQPVRLLGLAISNFPDEKMIDGVQLMIDFNR